jgi:hypothetical protein
MSSDATPLGQIIADAFNILAQQQTDLAMVKGCSRELYDEYVSLAAVYRAIGKRTLGKSKEDILEILGILDWKTRSELIVVLSKQFGFFKNE